MGADTRVIHTRLALFFTLPAVAAATHSMLDGHSYGPFQPTVPVQVPLWLAIFLKKTGRCQVCILLK